MIIKVFLGGPNEPRAENDLLVKIRNRVQSVRDHKYAIEGFRWSEPPYSIPQTPGADTQEKIEQAFPPKDADIVLMMFRDRLGSSHPDLRFPSYSAYELQCAIEARKVSMESLPRPQILIYKAGKSWLPVRDEDLVGKQPEEVKHIRERENQQSNEHIKLMEYLHALKKDVDFAATIYTIVDYHRSDDNLIEEAVNAINNIVEKIIREAERGSASVPPLRDFEGWPYRGLTEYTELYWDIFKGRDGRIQEAIDALKKKRLLAIYGSSGTGKTSLLKAGIIGSLRHNKENNKWGKAWVFIEVESRVDGVGFFEDLANQLAPPLINALGHEAGNAACIEADLKSIFADPPRGSAFNFDVAKKVFFERFVDPILRGKPFHDPVLAFVINQGEHLAARGARERDRFLRFIVTAVLCEQVRVLLTLREDVVGSVISDRSVDTQASDLCYLIPLYTPEADELRRMIEDPLHGGNLKVEEALVRRIIRDVGMRDPSEGVALPFVAQLLNRIAENARKKGRLTMTLNDMSEVGELAQVVETQARKLEQLASPDVFNKLFAALVRPGPGEWSLVRQAASRDRLKAVGVPDALLAQAIKERLLEEFSPDMIRLSHDILFRAWPRLKDWSEAERRDLELRWAIIDDATRWNKSGCDDDDIRLSEGILRIFGDQRILAGLPEERWLAVERYVQAARTKAARLDLVAAVNAGLPLEILRAIAEGGKLTDNERGEGTHQLRERFWAAVTGKYLEDYFNDPWAVNSCVTGGLSVAQIAALCGQTSLLQKLVERYSVDLSHRTEKGNTILTFAAYGGHRDTCDYLMDECGIKAGTLDEDGSSAAFWAAQRGHTDLALYLVHRGSPLDLTVIRGWSRLTEAVRSGLVEAVAAAITAGFSPHQRTEDGITAAMIACQYLHTEALDYLLKVHKVDATTRDNNGLSSYDYVCQGTLTIPPSERMKRTESIVRLLVEHGLPVDTAGAEGERAIIWASRLGSWELVAVLLRCGAKFESVPPSTEIPLLEAVFYGHPRVAEVLLAAGADVNARNADEMRALHLAAYRGNLDMVKVLLLQSRVHIDPKSVQGETPLMLASARGHAHVIAELLRHGSNKRLQNKEGHDSLLIAVGAHHVDAVRALLKENLEPSQAFAQVSM